MNSSRHRRHGIHTRIILERMAEYGVPVERVINAVAFRRTMPYSIRSMPMSSASRCWFRRACHQPWFGDHRAASVGSRSNHRAAQDKLCLPFNVFTPRPAATAVYERLFALYRKAYFALGTRPAEAVPLGENPARVAQYRH